MKGGTEASADVSKGLSDTNKNKLKTVGKAVGGAAILTGASAALSLGFQGARGAVGIVPGSASAVAPGVAGAALLPVLVGAAIMYRKKGAIKEALTSEKAVEALVAGDSDAGLQADGVLTKLTADETVAAAETGVEAGEKVAQAKKAGRSWNPFKDMKLKRPSSRKGSSTLETTDAGDGEEVDDSL